MMKIEIQQIINNPWAVNFAFFLGRVIPVWLGYPICNTIGTWIATQRDSKVTRAVRVNQWVTRGTHLGKEALDRAVEETLQNNARDLYSMYHYAQNLEAAKALFQVDARARAVIARPEFEKRGLVLAGLHLSNFDLILQSLCQQGFKALILTIPDPQGGRRVEFELRRKTGMNLIPASVGALRQAIKHLERGGVVLTGLDRPVTNPKHHPLFFGQAASLPTHHVFLALKARVPILIMAAHQQADGKYHVSCSEPIEMEADPDEQKGLLRNAEIVLKQAEGFIRSAPQQWNVPLPVWPQLLEEMPQ